MSSSARLFIGNLSYNATEDDLRAAFTETGYAPVSVSIVKDRETNQPRGFGFIELESPTKAKEALQVMDSTMIAGRSIRVSEAHERERRTSAPAQPEQSQRGRREERDRRW